MKYLWRIAGAFVLLGASACGALGQAPESTPTPTPVAASPDGTLQISEPYIQAAGKNGAGYLKINNTGTAADALLSVESDVAAAVELHQSKKGDGNMMQMLPVPRLEIAANDSVELRPGRYHIMLIDLKQELVKGEKINLTLNFERAGPILVTAEVVLGGKPAKNNAGTHEHAEDATMADHADTGALAPVQLSNGQRLNVIATTSIIGDLAKNVGGNKIALSVLVPPGTDPHGFTPTPQDAARMAGAHVILANGLGLEEFLTGLIENAGSHVPLVTLADGIDPHHADPTAAQNDHDHDHGGADPHVWMTPSNAVIMVQNIENALSALDPANAKTYSDNAAAYTARLETLDGWVQSQIDSIPQEKRLMVTDHNSFGYFANRYGLELVGAVVPAYSASAEPSAQELAQLQDAVVNRGAQAIFVGTTVNPVLAERLAQDTGVQLVPLYTGSLGEAGSGAESYIDFIRYNTTAIVNALK